MRTLLSLLASLSLSCAVVTEVEDDVAGPGACCWSGDVKECLYRALSGPGDCTYARCFPSFQQVYVCADGEESP